MTEHDFAVLPEPASMLRLAPLSDAEIADRARQVLVRDGWNQGQLTSTYGHHSHGSLDQEFPKGSHCIGGAVNLVLSGENSSYWQETPRAERFYQRLREVICDLDPLFRATGMNYPDEARLSIALWNNDRTQEEVFSVLEAMASGD